MATNGKQKGKRGELEGVQLLKKYGYEARRSVQFCGRSETSADLLTNLVNVRLEIKRGYNKLPYTSQSTAEDSPRKWIDKLKEEAAGKEFPLLLWRRDKDVWVAFFEIDSTIVYTADIPAALRLAESKGRMLYNESATVSPPSC